MESLINRNENIERQNHMLKDNLKININILDNECYLIRNLFGLEEQFTLIQYINDRDKTPPKKKCMVPTPQTLILGNEEPSLHFKHGDSPNIVTNMVQKANEILKRNDIEISIDTFDKICNYKSLSMATIVYESPNGHFPPHIDHCNNSFVYLMSLGCTANFMIKGPTMQNQKLFKFQSGDLLVFNASTEAALQHGVMSIDDESSCPKYLKEKFKLLKDKRYGVQCRLHI